MQLKILKPDDSQNENRDKKSDISSRLCLILQKNNVLQSQAFFFVSAN